MRLLASECPLPLLATYQPTTKIGNANPDPPIKIIKISAAKLVVVKPLQYSL